MLAAQRTRAAVTATPSKVLNRSSRAWVVPSKRNLSLTSIFHVGYIQPMAWEVEVTDEFEAWWDSLSEDEQVSVSAVVELLEESGPTLPRPYSDVVRTSRHPNMKELRIQQAGRPCRILYAFDPRRCAILLVGGDKTGNDHWYEEYVPYADKLYDRHLEELKQRRT
jgi:hypothetical protein